MAANPERSALLLDANFIRVVPKIPQAAELLANRLSIPNAAQRVECNEKTIDRWKQHSEFCERIVAPQGELLATIRGNGSPFGGKDSPFGSTASWHTGAGTATS